jgi:hypothetical protein
VRDVRQTPGEGIKEFSSQYTNHSTMRKIFLFLVLFALLAGCGKEKSNMKIKQAFIVENNIKAITDSLLSRFGVSEKFRIERGVKQVAQFWKQSDGSVSDFEMFCKQQFISHGKELDQLFDKLQDKFEILSGGFNSMILDLRWNLDIDIGSIHPVDEIFGGFNPSSHMQEDLFANKVAFITALNFPNYSLLEKTTYGPKWTKREWAFARMGDIFTERVPAEILQQFSVVNTNSDIYISQYNIFMGQLLDSNGKSLFPKEMKLLSHWNLRDELKSNFGKSDGMVKQDMIYEVMKRIISQDIPVDVINNDAFQWAPYSNKLYKNGNEIASSSEPDTRYQHIINNFKALHNYDPFYAVLNTAIKRAFDGNMEISAADAEKIFVGFLGSPVIRDAAILIEKRLGRKLKPYDIWYDGFKSRSGIPEEKLNTILNKKYPTAEAFKDDIPAILQKLGFKKEKASFIASKISVDPARGSGHAWGAEMHKMNSHLRTRVGKNGMDYKGYNIAVHELGHTVEQTISLHESDSYMIKGVPNTGFTEALAFLFQKRDLELLGMEPENPDAENMLILDNLWSAYEIMGVSLVDMRMWDWLYLHPEATASELKIEVIKIAKNVWNSFYAPVLGTKDEPILAIYSHMVSYPLYLPAYAVGQLINFQVEEYIKNKDFATETERMFSQGRLVPQVWMINAMGSELSGEPLLKMAAVAVDKLK